MDYNSWSLVGQVSVCLYAPSTAENLHAPSTAVLTLHLNTVCHAINGEGFFICYSSFSFDVVKQYLSV